MRFNKDGFMEFIKENFNYDNWARAVIGNAIDWAIENVEKEKLNDFIYEMVDGIEVEEIKEFMIEENNEMKKENESLSFEEIRDRIEEIANNNQENYVKAIISIEKGITDMDLLDQIYYEYTENDAISLLSEDIDYMINDEYQDLENEVEEVEPIKNQEKEEDTKNLNGNMATDVEIKTLTNKNGEKFKVANFAVAKNDEMGKVHYTNCTAYNDKIDKVKDFKKGDFVHLFGKEKITTGNDGKEYKSLTVLSAKLLKQKKVLKENAKNNKNTTRANTQEKSGRKKASAMKKLNEYKEKTKGQSTRNKKSKETER